MGLIGDERAAVLDSGDAALPVNTATASAVRSETTTSSDGTPLRGDANSSDLAPTRARTELTVSATSGVSICS